MTKYLANRLVKIGLGLVVFGWGPLWVIVLLAGAGLWPDPNPNPIGPGLLFFVTFVPGGADPRTVRSACERQIRNSHSANES